MPAMVKGGCLGRWFEELCRIRHQRIEECTAASGTKLSPKVLPKDGGVYAFWWTGDPAILTAPECSRDLILKGPGGRQVSLRIDNEWLGLSTELPVPLYVGKTSTSLRSRVGQHLMLAKKRILRIGNSARKQKAPTTSCQLRAGIEHMFPTTKDTRALILQHVGFSYVVLSGDDNAANRFYLEDLAIGMMRPPLNVDIER